MDSSVVSSATAQQTVVVQSPSPKRGSTDDSNAFKEHPLMNALIVGKIVEHLDFDPSFEQLKTLRLVSKIFTQVTLHLWRTSCAVLTLIPDPAPTVFTAPKQCDGIPVSQFLSEFQDPQSRFELAAKPFSKYKFKGITFDIQVCNKAGGPAQTFWNAIGPLIDSLFFEDCIFVKPRSVKKVICPMAQLLVTMIPNVKHLVLNAVVIQSAENSEKEQAFIEKSHLNLRSLTVYDNMEDVKLEDLFKMAPHLESIKGMDLPTQSVTVQTLVKPIYQARFNGKSGGISPLPLSNLKHLDLINSKTFLKNDYSWNWESVIPPAPLKNVAQLPLETLALYLEVSPGFSGVELPNDVELILNKYLFSFSGTLKTLKLYRPPLVPPYSRFLNGATGAGGEMTLLTELDLWGTIAPNLDFLNSTPNLKRLRINLGCYEKREQLKSRIREQNVNEHEDEDHECIKYQKYNKDMVAKVSTNLKEGGILCTRLEYLEIDHKFPKESLRILGKWMPNLRSLKTILNGRTILVVCEVWRELTELVCLHGSQIGDSCLIRDEETAGISGGPSPKLKICDLKDLERFQVDSYCGESELTEDAVYNGLLKMPRLKSVQICVNGSEMSEEAEKALRKDIQFCQVIRNDESEYTYEYDEDGNAICGCDRCTFRTDAANGFQDDEEDDDEGFGWFGSFGTLGSSYRYENMWGGSKDEDASDDSGESEEL